MKSEKLQEFKSDVSMIEKNVSIWNSLNPYEYIIEYYNNGLLENVIIVDTLQKGFFLFDSIKKSILYEIQVYENKLIIV